MCSRTSYHFSLSILFTHWMPNTRPCGASVAFYAAHLIPLEYKQRWESSRAGVTQSVVMKNADGRIEHNRSDVHMCANERVNPFICVFEFAGECTSEYIHKIMYSEHYLQAGSYYCGSACWCYSALRRFFSRPIWPISATSEFFFCLYWLQMQHIKRSLCLEQYLWMFGYLL